MDFHKAHGNFMHDHHFRDLHPQFEVLDWRGRSYCCSFAFITPHLRLIIEVKPFSPYTTEMDRQKYGNELNRKPFYPPWGIR